MASTQDLDHLSPGDQQKLAGEILDALKGIRFGTVEITVHDARVVQIDRRERFRLNVTQTNRAA